jgi:energy-coupling factor transporter ATP-binding protein EcfA2
MEVRKNSYEGICRKCGVKVPAMAGYIEKNPANDRWDTFHIACKTPETPVKAVAVSEDALGGAVDKVIDLMAKRFTEMVPELVQDNLMLLSRTDTIQIGKLPAVKIDKSHKMLTTLLTAVMAGASPMLVGPAGSGKTTLAEQIAKVLKREFYMEARVTSEFKLVGFVDAAGHVVRTQFREAYEKGGVFLFDEVDASDADAMTAFNAALANGRCAFPDKLVPRHKDFVAIAAGNTFGRGADRQYVGRNQLDAATLDRFQVFEVDYDEQLEMEIAGDANWTRHVQKVRAAVATEKVRHIVSPRASIMGARMLAAGMERKAVEEACVWKGLDEGNRARVESRMGRA